MEIIQKCFSDFHCDLTSADNTERSRRPKYVSNSEKVEKIHDVMLNEPQVNLEKLAEIPKMSNSSFFNIVYVILGIKKLFARWLPRFLTEDQNRIRVMTSKQN